MKKPSTILHHYSPAFKLEAVEQIVKYHQKAIDVARSLDIDPSTLRKWVRQYRDELQEMAPRSQALTVEQRRIKELEKQVKRLEMEKAILKQAAVLMSETPGTFTR